MGLFSAIFGETTEAKAMRWMDELWEALPQLLPQGDAYERSEDEPEIIIRHGSAHVVVGIGSDDEGDGYVIIKSPLVFLPKENLLPFYRRLLDLNCGDLMLGALATEGNTILLRTTVPMAGLDEDGFRFWVFSTLGLADELDDLLIDEFGARRFEN